MTDPKRWRNARFDNDSQRAQFLARVETLTVEGIEVEALSDESARIRFRAPSRFEIGVAGMIQAHGGIVLPTSR